MKEFLEKTLRQNVIMTENKEVYKKLPLAYRGRYDIFTVETNGVLWMAIHPKDNVGLVMLRRDRAGVEKMTGLNCAIFLDRTTFYIKEKMMEEGIPFVIEGKQVFLPFIGYLLSKENERELAPVYLISFLTQKMLLMAIYERWNEVKVSDAAKRIGVSTKSASRCFDELEYLNIDVLGMKGKSRVINIPNDRKQVWQQIENVLRNPVIRSLVNGYGVRLGNDEGDTVLRCASVDALCIPYIRIAPTCINSCDYLCRVLNLCHNIGPPLFVLWYKSTESFRALHFHDSYVNLQSALLGYLLISVVVSNA